MKKRLLVLVGILALLMVGCSNSAQGGSSGEVEKKERYSFVIGSGHSPAGFPYVSAAQDYFVPTVIEKAAALGYEVSFTEAYGGTIAPLADVFEATETGQLDIGLCSTIFEPTKAMLLNYNAYMPFGINDIKDTYEIGTKIYDANKEAIDNMLADYDLKYVTLAIPISSYNLLTDFEVNTFDDLKGHKIAAAGANLAVLDNTGAVGVQSNLNEAYTSIQTGVYEGWVVWPEGVTGYKLEEVAPYYLKTTFGSSNFQTMFMNLDVWNSLPEDLQNVIIESAAVYIEKGLDRAVEEDAAAYGIMEASEVRVAEMAEAERNKWMDSIADPAAPAIEELEAAGLPGRKVFSEYYSFAEELGYSFHRKFGQ